MIKTVEFRLMMCVYVIMFALWLMACVIWSQVRADDASIDCTIFAQIEWDINHYQKIADSSEWLRRVVALKRIDDIAPLYWERWNLCYSNS
jgi:hypothetical protein